MYVKNTKMTTQEYALPTGHVVEVRERTGQDESIISQMSSLKDNKATDNYLSRIITRSSYSTSQDGRLTPDDCGRMANIDRYYVLLCERVLSYGPLLKFRRIWDAGKKEAVEADYTEDLSAFMYDYTKPQDYPGASSKAPKPYPKGKTEWVESSLPSGMEVKVLAYLNGLGERLMLSAGDNVNRNTEFLARELHVKTPMGTWAKVDGDFSRFSPRDMMALRNLVRESEVNWTAAIVVPHPTKPELEERVDLFEIPDFYFPLEI